MTLIDMLAEVEATLASVSSIRNTTPDFLLGLTASIKAAQTRVGEVLTLADAMLNEMGAAEKFAAGLDPIQLTVNVSNLVAITGAVPYLVDVGNQLGVMLKTLERLDAVLELN